MLKNRRIFFSGHGVLMHVFGWEFDP